MNFLTFATLGVGVVLLICKAYYMGKAQHLEIYGERK